MDFTEAIMSDSDEMSDTIKNRMKVESDDGEFKKGKKSGVDLDKFLRISYIIN